MRYTCHLMKRFILFVILVALTLLAISKWNQRRGTPETFTPATAPNLGEMPVLAALDQETSRLLQTVIPSVVSITTSRKVQAPQIIDPFTLLCTPLIWDLCNNGILSPSLFS